MWQASELASSRAGVTDGLGIKPVARASSETIGLINQRRVSFVGYDEAEDQHFLVETEVHPVNSRVRDALKGKGLLGAADSGFKHWKELTSPTRKSATNVFIRQMP
jgi:hypothetical protein